MKDKIAVVYEFLQEMSAKHQVDIDSLNIHKTNGEIFVQQYRPDHFVIFKVLEVIPIKSN